MFTSSFTSSGLEFWSANHISKWKVSKNIKFLGEISNARPYNLLETNVHKTLVDNYFDNHYNKYYNGLLLLQ